MNRECTFAEFMAIMKAHLYQQTNLYSHVYHLNFPDFYDRISQKKVREMCDAERDKFLKSQEFEKGAQQKFREMKYQKMTAKEIYKLVDCLEDTMDLWSYGHNTADIPLHNLFIPTKTTLMTKPKLVEAEDELGWRLVDRKDKKTTMPRIHPTMPLSPLKGVPLQPNTFLGRDQNI